MKTKTKLTAKRRATIKKLRTLHAFLKTRRENEFYFGNFVSERDANGCGTVCCLVGWTPAAFPGDSTAQCVWRISGRAANVFYGLTAPEWYRLFGPGAATSGDSGLHGGVSLAVALAHLERCINDMGAGIDIGSEQYGQWIDEFNERHHVAGGYVP